MTTTLFQYVGYAAASNLAFDGVKSRFALCCSQLGLVESNLMCQLELANSTMGMFQTFDSNKTTMFIVVLHSHNSECEQIFNASTTSLEQPTTLLHSTTK